MRALTATELQMVDGAGIFSDIAHGVEDAYHAVKNFVDGTDAEQHPCSGAAAAYGTLRGGASGTAKAGVAAGIIEVGGLGPEDPFADVGAGTVLAGGFVSGARNGALKQAAKCVAAKSKSD